MNRPLVFMDDTEPGITRRLIRGKWGYFAPDGSRITDRDEIDRLNRIALPPAYRDAWFCPNPDAHLLAIGFDERARKQYRYNPHFRLEQEARKFELCSGFGKALPALRKRVAADLTLRSLSRERAIASVVALLDTGQIRVGNEFYAKTNKTFGATTLRMRHATLEGGRLRLRFKAKSGKQREVVCSDRQLIRFVRRMQDLPGQHLFQYLDDEGQPVPIGSADVNEYVRDIMGAEFTARNFRTWAASTMAFGHVFENPKIPLRHLLEAVSEQLGNTPAIARKSYIHPAVLAAANGGELAALLPEKLPRGTEWLRREERGLIDFLDRAPATETILRPPPSKAARR